MNEQRPLGRATLGALGVVYGDIGTSPLYALKGATTIAGGGAADSGTVLGVLSLIFWSMFIVITLKYVVLILRSDNAGEGGILSLLALVQQKLGTSSAWALRFGAVAALGTALFYCDGMITPAISVLSRRRGPRGPEPEFERMVLPVTLTDHSGAVRAAEARHRARRRAVRADHGGLVRDARRARHHQIARAPEVLAALFPGYALALLAQHPAVALAILGAVFLVLTGGEALYADMGHFGKQPVRLAWFALVWPALLLNYFGQGALMLDVTRGRSNPFFGLASASALPLLVLLATAATVIASQATISGAFSLTRQAVQLDLLPRVQILPDVARRARPDLRAGREPRSVPRRRCVRPRVRLVGCSHGRLWRGRGRHDADHDASRRRRRAGRRGSGPRGASSPCSGCLSSSTSPLSPATPRRSRVAAGCRSLLAALMFVGFITWRDGRAKLRHELRERAVPWTALPGLWTQPRACPAPRCSS